MIFPVITILLLAHLCSPQPIGNQSKRVQRDGAPIPKGEDLDPSVSLFVKEAERQGLALGSAIPLGSRGRAFSELNGVHRNSESPLVNGGLRKNPAAGQGFPTAFVHRTFGGFRFDREHREESPQLHAGHSTRLSSHPGGQLQAIRETPSDHLKNPNSQHNQHANSHSKDFVFFNQNSINPDINIIPDQRQSFVKTQEVDFQRKKTSSGNLLNLPQRPVVGFKLPIQNHFVSLFPSSNSNAGSANEPDAQKVTGLGQSQSSHGNFGDFSSGHNEQRNKHPTHKLTSVPFRDEPTNPGNSFVPIQSLTFNSNQLQFQQPLQNPRSNIQQTRFQQHNDQGNTDQSQHFKQLNNDHRNNVRPEHFQRFTKSHENSFQQNHFQRLNNEHINNGQKEHFQSPSRELGQTDKDFIFHSLPPTRQTFLRESRNIFTENNPSAKESKHTFESNQNSALNPKSNSHSVAQPPNQGREGTVISSGSSNPEFGQGFILRLQPSLVLNSASSEDDFRKDSSVSSNNFPVDSPLPLEDHKTPLPHRSEGQFIKQETASEEKDPVKFHINPNLEENIFSVNDFANFRPSFFGRSLEFQESNIVPEGRSLGDDSHSLHTKEFAPGVWQGGFLPSSFFAPLST